MSGELSQQDDGLSRTTAFQLLSHSHRLALLECLDEHGEPLTLTDVSEEVACSIEDEALQNMDAASVKIIYVSLYHSHVPRLQSHDVVRYSQERDLVALTQQGERLVEYMNRLGEFY